MWAEQLQRLGLKVTQARVKILDIFSKEAGGHHSAEDIHKQLSVTGDDIALATVYRVLTQFEALGLIQRHHFEAGTAVYELNQGEHHDHLVCTGCGMVEEFVDEVIEARQAEIAANAGFRMLNHALLIYGLCNRCQA